MTFRKDDSRRSERTLAENQSWLRGFAVTLLKPHPIEDRIRGQMLGGLMKTDVLNEVLIFQED